MLTSCAVQNWSGEALCGTYTVYEDREAGSGRTIALNILVLPARDAANREADPVVYFSGGPGQASTAGLSYWAGLLPELHATRDFVAVDQRGTGASNPLSCQGALPSGAASLFGALFPSDHVDSCRERLEARADLRLYTTPIAADDIATVLAALGYESVNVFGASYGTRIGLVFARQHPELVRTLTVNGVAPPHRSAYLEGPPTVQDGLDRQFAACAADPTCHAQYPDPRADVDTLMARLASPAEVTVDFNGAALTTLFHRGDLAYALRGLLYTQAAQNIAPWARNAVETGDLTRFATYYLGRAQWVAGSFATGMHLSILCAEDIMRFTPSEAAAVTAGTLVGTAVYDRYRSACERWPTGWLPPGYNEPVRVEAPTLLVSGGRDPATPHGFGEDAASFLSVGHHLVVPDGYHVPRNECVLAAQSRLVRTGSVEGLPATCPGS